MIEGSLELFFCNPCVEQYVQNPRLHPCKLLLPLLLELRTCKNQVMTGLWFPHTEVAHAALDLSYNAEIREKIPYPCSNLKKGRLRCSGEVAEIVWFGGELRGL